MIFIFLVFILSFPSAEFFLILQAKLICCIDFWLSFRSICHFLLIVFSLFFDVFRKKLKKEIVQAIIRVKSINLCQLILFSQNLQ